MDIIEINKDLIPYYFSIELGSVVCEIQVDYNSAGDFFTFGLSVDNNVISVGEKLVFGKELFACCRANKNMPKIKITPVDFSGGNNSITYDNFCSGVFLKVEEL